MNAQEIIQYIAQAEKKTPVKLYIKEKEPIDYGAAKVFGCGDKIVFGDWKDLKAVLENNQDKIAECFGDFETFKEKMSALALGQFGSGWAFLSANKAGDLFLSASPNQDNPISEGTGNIPIFTIDVWEHAYYLKYKNLRAKYVEEIWKLVDWKAVEKNYKRVTG